MSPLLSGDFFFYLLGEALFLGSKQLFLFPTQEAISPFKFLVFLSELRMVCTLYEIIAVRIITPTTITTRLQKGIGWIKPHTLPVPPTPISIEIKFVFLSVPSSLSLKMYWLDKKRNLQCSKYTWNYSFWQYKYSIFGNVFNFLIFWRNIKFISRKFSIYFQIETITPVVKLGQFCCNFRLTNRLYFGNWATFQFSQ